MKYDGGSDKLFPILLFRNNVRARDNIEGVINLSDIVGILVLAECIFTFILFGPRRMLDDSFMIEIVVL